jgi:hypothetical protein
MGYRLSIIDPTFGCDAGDGLLMHETLKYIGPTTIGISVMIVTNNFSAMVTKNNDRQVCLFIHVMIDVIDDRNVYQPR